MIEFHIDTDESDMGQLSNLFYSSTFLETYSMLKRVDNTKALLIADIVKSGSGFDIENSFDEFVSKSYRKLNITLKRLKEIGIYQKDTSGILFSLDLAWNTWISSVIYLVDEKLNSGDKSIIDITSAIPIREEFWYYAIETIVAEHQPETFKDETTNNYALILKQHIKELYFIVTLLAYLDYIMQKQKQEDVDDQISELIKKQKKLESTIQNLEEQKNSLQKQNSALKERNSKLASELQSYENKLRKKCLSLEHSYENKQKDYEGKIDFYRQQNAILRSILDNAMRDADDTSTVSEDDADFPCEDSDTSLQQPEKNILPKTGVVFLGGHQTLVSKLKKLHPKWTFINDTSKRLIPDLNSYKIAFVFNKHLSHKLFYRFNSTINENASIVYVTSTNIEKLEAEMSESYRILTDDLSRQSKVC